MPKTPVNVTSRREQMDEAKLTGSRPHLSPKEREIAIAALGQRVSGNPAEAAAQLLAGIAVLDGKHLPVQVWPAGMSLEDAAEWHQSNANELRERSARIQARVLGVTPSGQKLPGEHEDCLQTIPSPAQLQQERASSAQDHREADTDSPLPSDPSPHSGSSDVC